MNNWLLKNEWLLKPLMRFDTHFFKLFQISIFEVWGIVRPKRDPDRKVKILLYLIGTLTTAITLSGMLLGYMRAYLRYDYEQGKPPTLSPLSRHTRAGLVVGGIMIWALIALIICTVALFIGVGLISTGTAVIYFISNSVIMFSTMLLFNIKRYKIARDFAESTKHGSARFAEHSDIKEYLEQPKGIYIGGGMRFNDRGHLLTIAGTRGGKATNLIIPNMLYTYSYEGSWVVVDPKGEAAAICSELQWSMGKKVYVLNPWDLLPGKMPHSITYNPFDLLADKNSIHLIDDAQVIAEMLVPIDVNDRDKFFTDTARSIIAGLIAYIAFTRNKFERNLNTLYSIVRKSDDDWVDVLIDMYACGSDDNLNGKMIALIAEEIKKIMRSGDRTYGIIMATMLQATDFIKSPVLQNTFETGFDPAKLRDGNAVLYVIIPADKLSSHSRWLRLVIMTLIRSVIRNPNKDNKVCFLLDEFASLGYLSEIETALNTYAGYGVSIWPVLQSLIQLKGLYKDNWENFIANATARTFFSVNDNFTAKYLSDSMGIKTNIFSRPTKKGEPDENETTPRQLMTPDEIRRSSGKNIIAFIGDKPPLLYPKTPYYEMQEFHYDDGTPVYNPNPYIV